VLTKFQLEVQKDVLLNGTPSATSTQKPLIPILFSHGYKGTRAVYTGLFRDLASHGYIVFGFDHNDGSCYFYKDKSGKECYFEVPEKSVFVEKDRKE
jgi:predicted dienelactone hydrolase